MEQSWPCDGAEVVLLVHLQATGQPLSCHLLGTERVAMRPPVAEGCGGFSSGMEGRSKVGRGQGRWHAGSPRRRPLFSSSSYTAIALGPKLIPPQKALVAWGASSLSSSNRVQHVASGLRISLQEARVRSGC